MRLSMFRAKLLEEVTAARALRPLDQRIQPHLYCIAALMRRILHRARARDEGMQVRLYPNNNQPPHDHQEALLRLCGVILHSREFRPTHPVARAERPPGEEWYCTIVSDKDHQKLSRRVISISDLLDVAEDVATDDEALLQPVLGSARTQLTRITKLPDDEPAGDEIMELLIDLFDLARATNNTTAEGSMKAIIPVRPVFSEGQIVGGTPIQTFEVSYTTLFDNLFIKWRLSPFVQFEVGEGNRRQLLVEKPKGDEGGVEFLHLPAPELLAFLQSLEAQWR